MAKQHTIRRIKTSPKTVCSKVEDELSILTDQKYSGSFSVTGSMRDGGICHADFKVEPVKKDMLV